ncbi:MAG: alpha-ketoglutarate-dependent dioxygenase AlkB [Timaviella obliquedivisa GSE-PSE-MK23-08B]|jgi:alkylated DNA repair protein (DNA oxidative demethylase)|nr:alpha-ketoglutarate-dependent dioxygenase AlkB [Timaviella obliquedivisa GSE-PSE-MK23-08B]
MANKTKSAIGQLDLIPRQIAVLASGVIHLPNFLLLSEQSELVVALRKWTEGGWYTPAMPNGVSMVHPLACLGYRWKPYGYFAARSPLPGELINLAVLALTQARSEEYLPYFPQTAIVNFFPVGASLGMHQDRSEAEELIQQGRPIVTLSLGDSAIFRLGNINDKGLPWQDIELRSGDALIMAGYSRLAYHGVMKILPGTAPADLDMKTGRISVTLREVHS